MRGLIFGFIFLTGILPSLRAATPIRNDSTGIILLQKEGFENLDKPMLFRRAQQDQAYFDVVTPDNLLYHIETDRVVKVVFFLNPSTFPTEFGQEDLTVIKAKIDELHAFAKLSPDAAKAAASQLEYLQNVYDTQSARYKQSVEINTQKFNSEQEKEAFDKKCDLLRLALQASTGDIKRSEELVSTMEPLAARSQLLTNVLAKWNQEKTRALQLAGEAYDLWTATLKAHPENFKPVTDLKQIPDFPADARGKLADLQAQLDQFRTGVTFPQTLLYCKNEVPAVFLLNELPKFVDKTKAGKYADATAISQKALQQLGPDQIVDPYTPILTTFKNYSDVVANLQNRYFRQLTKAKAAEGNFTNREVLVEYQKAYDIIPDPAIAAKIAQLKQKIKNE